MSKRTKKKPLSGILNDPKRDFPRKSQLRKVSSVIIPAIAGAVLGNMVIPGVGGRILGGAFASILVSNKKKVTKMNKVPVFYSFHFENDVMRVQQIRNIGSIEGNSATTPNEWEQLKRNGKTAVENWIHKNMSYKRCVIVLIGADTASRPWVRHEIEKAWNDGKALLGIYIHNIKCPRKGTSEKGDNPFDKFSFSDGKKMSTLVPCYDPNPQNAYQDISDNIQTWISNAISDKCN